MAATRNARNAPIGRPNATRYDNLCTRLANHPISTHARIPLIVDPVTIPTINGAVSGAQISALNPSNTPRIPPSTSPSSALFVTPPKSLVGFVLTWQLD